MLKDIFIEGNGGIVGWVTRLGVSATALLLVLWFLLTRVDEGLTKLEARVEAANSKMEQAQINMTAYANEDRKFKQDMLRTMRQSCVIAAKTDDQRQGCF